MEAFADLSAGFCSRIDKELVEDGAPGAVRDGSTARAGRPGDRDRTKVECVCMDRRTTGGDEAIKQAPSRRGSYAERLHDMGRERVARKRGAIEEQNAVALAGQQHCGR